MKYMLLVAMVLCVGGLTAACEIQVIPSESDVIVENGHEFYPGLTHPDVNESICSIMQDCEKTKLAPFMTDIEGLMNLVNTQMVEQAQQIETLEQRIDSATKAISVLTILFVTFIFIAGVCAAKQT